jgi:kynurenine formamidase
MKAFRMKNFVSLVCGSALLMVNSAPLVIGAEKPFAAGRWVDLTHDFSAETIYWPTAQGFALETEHKGMTPGGYFYAANQYHASEHGGTHIDAPIHFAEGHKILEQIPLEQLTGAAIVVDVSEKALKDADYLIKVSDLKAWER